MYQSAQKVRNFTYSNDMIEAELKKTGAVILNTPLGSRLSSKAKVKHLIYSTCINNLATVVSVVLEI